MFCTYGMGAFGMPAKNAAWHNKTHPAERTYANIAAMREQLKSMGLLLDWSREIAEAGIPIPKTHNHAKLFDHLPLSERKESGQRYRAIRHPTMRATIEEALAFSAAVFERWRYIHEHQSVEASMLEMQRAFNALAHDL
jgi:hypothetical protein